MYYVKIKWEMNMINQEMDLIIIKVMFTNNSCQRSYKDERDA